MTPSPFDAPVLARRVQHYLREAARRSASCERVGAFTCAFSIENDNPFLNYAIPDDDARPGKAEIEALCEVFRRRKRIPRLEYLPDAAPALQAVLVSCGFEAERHLPLMICAPGEERLLPVAAGFEVVSPATGADFADMAAAQGEAYANQQLGPASLKRTVKRSGVAMLAREIATGICAGGGTAMPPMDGISEIAGIGVREHYRRRGLAGAINAALTAAIFAQGAALAWLTPEHEYTARVYSRAGFRNACAVIHIRRA